MSSDKFPENKARLETGIAGEASRVFHDVKQGFMRNRILGYWRVTKIPLWNTFNLVLSIRLPRFHIMYIHFVIL